MNGRIDTLDLPAFLRLPSPICGDCARRRRIAQWSVPSTLTDTLVLIVEDPFICNYLTALLSRRGYAVMLAGADRAVDMLRESPRAVVLITNSPGLFLRFVDRLPLLYLSAAPDLSLAARFHRCRVVVKPFRAEHFLGALEELCAEAVHA